MESILLDDTITKLDDARLNKIQDDYVKIDYNDVTLENISPYGEPEQSIFRQCRACGKVFPSKPTNTTVYRCSLCYSDTTKDRIAFFISLPIKMYLKYK